MININVNIEEQGINLGQVLSRLQNLSPLMREVAGIMQSSVDLAFRNQKDPVTGSPWPALNPQYASQRAERGHSGKILQVSGGLNLSIDRHIDQSRDGFSILVGTNHHLAAVHNFGARTRPHVIRAKNKKALSIPGIGPRKAVNHPGSVIPARRFLGLSPHHAEDIRLAVLKHLDLA